MSRTSEIKETAFFCNGTWHMARMQYRVSGLIYSHATLIAKNSGLYSASAKNTAQFLGYEEKQIRRGFKELEEAGFFEYAGGGNFNTTSYRVVLHKNWAVKHPGRCAIKSEFPWAGEGDPLAPQLYAVSGCKKKFFPHQIALLRSTGLPESMIIEEFEQFLAHWRPQGKADSRYWFDRFLDLLKADTPKGNEIDSLNRAIYESTGHLCPARYRSVLTDLLEGRTKKEVVNAYRRFLQESGLTEGTISAFCHAFGMAA